MTPYLLLAVAIFSIGTYGVLARRNVLIVLMSLELMLNGVNLALVAFARQVDVGSAEPHGHVFVMMVMAVAAAEVAVGLSILIALFRGRKTIDTAEVSSMKG